MTARLAAWLKSLVDGIGAAIGAAFASQLPEFVQQYLQRLGGHRDEAFRFVQMLKSQGMEASNAVFTMAQTRADMLAQSYDAIAQAGDLGRPAVFLRHVDIDIARAAMDLFHPAVPLTPAGLVYGGVGLILGVAAMNLALAPFALFRRRART
jgi:Protein of unknown function (DUF2937)